jgi:hypothetical protein
MPDLEIFVSEWKNIQGTDGMVINQALYQISKNLVLKNFKITLQGKKRN